MCHRQVWLLMFSSTRDPVTSLPSPSRARTSSSRSVELVLQRRHLRHALPGQPGEQRGVDREPSRACRPDDPQHVLEVALLGQEPAGPAGGGPGRDRRGRDRGQQDHARIRSQRDDLRRGLEPVRARQLTSISTTSGSRRAGIATPWRRWWRGRRSRGRAPGRARPCRSSAKVLWSSTTRMRVVVTLGTGHGSLPSARLPSSGRSQQSMTPKALPRNGRIVEPCTPTGTRQAPMVPMRVDGARPRQQTGAGHRTSRAAVPGPHGTSARAGCAVVGARAAGGMQPDDGVEQQAELAVVLVCPTQEADIGLLQPGARCAAELGGVQPAAPLVGAHAVRVLPAGLVAAQQGQPGGLVERVAPRAPPRPSAPRPVRQARDLGGGLEQAPVHAVRVGPPRLGQPAVVGLLRQERSPAERLPSRSIGSAAAAGDLGSSAVPRSRS